MYRSQIFAFFLVGLFGMTSSACLKKVPWPDPIPCEELACEAQNRVCEVVSVLQNRCGKCQPDFVEQAGVCVERPANTCESLQCTQQGRQCDAPQQGDATCTACLDGLTERGGQCIQVVQCDDLDCAEQGRQCEQPGDADAICTDCLDNFIEEEGACLALPPTISCDELDCGAQNRACEKEATLDAVCSDCLDGFIDEEGICVVNHCAGEICGTNEACINGASSYHCECIPGTEDIGDGCERLIQQLSAGAFHACAVSAGDLYCWGINAYGQLGQPPSFTILSPTRMARVDDVAWDTVSAGNTHTCAIAQNKLFCWGDNNYGELGDGTQDHSTLPVPVRPDLNWTDISASSDYSCGIADGELYCWGGNYRGQLGFSTVDDAPQLTPRRVGTLSDWRMIRAGGNHACGIANDKLYCWGPNVSGEVGLKDWASADEPTAIDSSISWSHIDAASFHSCAITTGRELYCWGANGQHQLGFSEPGAVDVPTHVPGLTRLNSISVSENHSCATANGELYCWGANDRGQLGDGSGSSSEVPMRIGMNLSDWNSVSSDGDYSCAFAGRKAYCWGSNEYGQLGTGDTTNRPLPTLVVLP